MTDVCSKLIKKKKSIIKNFQKTEANEIEKKTKLKKSDETKTE